jgi:UDP-N-acetylglucosamine 2-epimerase (non-hydrolysing)
MSKTLGAKGFGGMSEESGNRLVVCVVGTRPEAVKMAPIIPALKRVSGVEVRLVTTGQHRGLLDQALADFGLAADIDLDLMRPSQTLADLTSRALTGLTDVFAELAPSLVLAQGDTTTVLASALAAYYQQIPFGHIEAGLRTGQPYRPFPEEKNRVLASHLASLHFAPTDQTRNNLVREGIDPGSIYVTGNSVIDALRITANRSVPPTLEVKTPKFLLVTAHRRENHGKPLEHVCEALARLIERHPDLSVVFPVHPNPRVVEIVKPRLGQLDRVHLIDPQGYVEFVGLMKQAFLILTDSGGLQEEAPALGKPVLVLRDETERPEAILAGTAQLVGTDSAAICEAVESLLSDASRYARFQSVVNPYGDGWAADRIARVIHRYLGLTPAALPEGVAEVWNSSVCDTYGKVVTKSL